MKKDLIKKLLKFQKSEITEHHIYNRLSEFVKHPKNKKILKHLSKDELRHYNLWKKYTNQEIKPSKIKIFLYSLIAKVFGLTFGIKLMEKGEDSAQRAYLKIIKQLPEAKKIIKDEHDHEKKIISMIDEDLLNYMGSIVLGLNDAIVELTGVLAGLTFAFQNSQIVGVAGLITGIAASTSMGASEYLSSKTEGKIKPLKSAFYTGSAYLLAVIFLISPYFLLDSLALSLISALGTAVLIIFLFNFYVSITNDLPFWKRFGEMTAISLGVAVFSFIIGLIIRNFLNI